MKFAYEKDLKSHNQIHQQKSQSQKTPFSCTTCEKYFADRFSHQQHTCPQSIRSRERLNLLPQEDEFLKSQGFLTKDDFNRHERSNTEKDQLICNQCDKKFSSPDELNNHSKTHTCKFLLQNKCKYGSSGKNHNGICSYAHPRLCIYFQTTGRCKKGDKCDFLHTSNNRGNHSSARPEIRGYKHGNRNQGPTIDTAFLGESTILEYLDKYLNQKLQDLSNNNNSRSRGPQWMARR